MAQKVTKSTTDHETIRRWVEERGGSPAAVEGTSRGEGDPGIIRIDFPGYTGEGQLRRVSWDEWFKKLDESGLAFVYEETTASGQRSNFNELVARETLEARAQGKRTSRRRAVAGAAAARGAARRRSARSASTRSRGRGQARGTRAGGRRAAAKQGGRRAASTRGSGRRQAGRAEAARTTSRRGGSRGGSSRRSSRRRSTRGGPSRRGR
jgi:hypothetical protein